MPTDLNQVRVVVRCQSCRSKMGGPGSRVLTLKQCPKCENGDLFLETDFRLADGRVLSAGTSLGDWKAAVDAKQPQIASAAHAHSSNQPPVSTSDHSLKPRPTLLWFLVAAFLMGCLLTVVPAYLLWPTSKSDGYLPHTGGHTDDDGAPLRAGANKAVGAAPSVDRVRELEGELLRANDNLATARAKALEFEKMTTALRTQVDSLRRDSGAREDEAATLASKLLRTEDLLEEALREVKQLQDTQAGLIRLLSSGPGVLQVSPLFASNLVVSRSYFTVSRSVYVSVVWMGEEVQSKFTELQFTGVDSKPIGKKIPLLAAEAASGFWSGLISVSDASESVEMLIAPRAKLSGTGAGTEANVNFPEIRVGGYTGLAALAFVACDISEIRSLGDYSVCKYFTLLYSVDESAFTRSIDSMWFQLREWGPDGKAKTTGQNYQAEVKEQPGSDGFRTVTATIRIPAWSPPGVLWFLTVSPGPKDVKVAQPPPAPADKPVRAPPVGANGKPVGSRSYGSALNGKPYLGGQEGHWISTNIASGRYILLEDKSLWQVDTLDRIDSMLWLAIDSIEVLEHQGLPNEYKLYNVSDKRSVVAKHLGSSPKQSLKSVEESGDLLTLGDGSRWKVSFGDQMTVRSWSSGDLVYVVKNGVSYVLVNADRRAIAEGSYDG